MSLERYSQGLQEFSARQQLGRVSQVVGLVVRARGLQAEMGEHCVIHNDMGHVDAEVVGFQGAETLLMPLGDSSGLKPGTAVSASGHHLQVTVGENLLGRVIDGLGKPIDGKGPLSGPRRSVDAPPPGPLKRQPISNRLELGVKVLDSLIPLGQGQRLGIFAGSGVGKSSLLGMIARGSQAQVNVICLVGERGREVQEFVDQHLGEAISHSVVVVTTSDRPALERIKALAVATTIAEEFRDRGSHVLLMCDSLTRLAMAQRELGLATGEPPATRGYPPSVWATMPQLLERAGAIAGSGSITGLYTVLVEGDDMNEPVADAARAILDGHVVLSRDLAHQNHYPAVDVLQSVSRLQGDLLSPEVLESAGSLRELMAAYAERRDMIALGAYQAGSEPLVDRAVALHPQIEAFLCQPPLELVSASDSDAQLVALVEEEGLPEQSENPSEPPVVPVLGAEL